MIPLGTVAKITPSVGPSLISLYNLYPSATIIGLPATGYSSGQSMNLMEEIAAKTLPPGAGFEWTAMSYQEKIVGGQIYYAFGLALLLVYLVLAGQYESWYAPISVILAVPLSLLGPMMVLTGLRIENNLYTQIGIILLIALSAKNAILIVEVALELHVRDRKPLLESAIEAARARFRPILMTSFAFILGVVPLVLATGAGANARKSIGITVFSGMLASTCLAVLFVPTFFVVIQRFENWLAERKREESSPVRRRCRRRRARRISDSRRPGTGRRRRRLMRHLAPTPSPSACRGSRRRASPISAFGVFSRPSITSSCTFSLPEATQDCRSASAASRSFM